MEVISLPVTPSIIPESAPATRIAVLEYIKKQGTFGATADEVAAAFGSSHNHVAPRITELKKMALVAPTAFRRKTRTGSPARVLIASN